MTGNFWERLSDEEASRIDEIIADRIGGEAKEPFEIEEFCAQVAWMQTCPVYPYNFEADIPCKYLYEEGYEDYRCPVARTPGGIFKPIIEKGSEEQKKSLEYLADMLVRYGEMENPPSEPSPYCISDAILIYSGLGLDKKADELRERHPALRNVKSTN